MIAGPTPVRRDICLIGGGHSHVHVLRRFGMKPEPGVRLTLVAAEIETPYSGMLPGLIAGHYSHDEAHIDLGPLARFAGARLIRSPASGLDLAARRVLFGDRPPLAFDLVSIDTGSTPGLDVPGAAGRVLPVKPARGFLEGWARIQRRAGASARPLRIGVVGGGAGGVELALCLQYRLAETGHPPQLHLFIDGQEVLTSHAPAVRRIFDRILGERGIVVHAASRVTAVEDGRVVTEAGAREDLDEIVWVTGASPAAWLPETGLQLDERGFVAVDATLRSLSHPFVFAAGDVAGVTGHPRPKSGVFAVRQGPPLSANLRLAALDRPPRPFRPQRRFLSLISTGDRYAVASRGGWALEGALLWRLKDWIDRRFMTRFNRLPAMLEPAAPMRCGGCGGKIGALPLAGALARLGHDAAGPEDAAVVERPDGLLALRTVDYLKSFVDDPFVMGEITANHALSDIQAMGGVPETALAIAVLPPGDPAKVEEELFQLLAGAGRTFAAAGVRLVGGHSSEGAEPALGFAVEGRVAPANLLPKSGGAIGDVLVLTKPLGTGTLLAADMRRRAKGRWIGAAIDVMRRSNAAAAACLRRHGAHACTDVTGFGLAGHLLEMLRGSSFRAEIEIAALPLLEGAAETLAAGITSTLAPENARAAMAEIEADGPVPPILFDPQTAGGLLAFVSQSAAEACLEELNRRDEPGAVAIGRLVARSPGAAPIRLVQASPRIRPGPPAPA